MAAPKLATTEEVAEYLGGDISRRTLEDWRSKRTGPRYIHVGQQVRYRWTDVDAWLKERTVQTVA